jgi:pimeloyl-ACP methyl ester carboxylesterase
MVAALKPTFPPDYDHTADAIEIWKSMRRDDGQLNMHLLIRYILDRREHEQRWVGALENADVPRAFTWGMLDPVSGAHMAERIRERLPHAPFTALDDVGHWPPLEAPDRVVESVLFNR